jgi:hypothetical protein
MGRQARAVAKEIKAEIVDERTPIAGPRKSARGAGAGLAPKARQAAEAKIASDLHLYLEAASGIEPLYGALQALGPFPAFHRSWR